ncbi:MAG: BtpA/SgcQ family protein, partial [Mesorhizobium sp.]|nr:BtpA/SgcQ family protein [Mesorhizobium sp.]
MTTRESKPVLERLFGTSKPIIGMVHVLPLPGSPYYRNGSLAQVYEQAVEEALILEEGGVDGILLENAGDIPFLKPDDIGFETIGGMSVIGDRVRRATKLPLGFNIVANAAKASLACAKSSGAQFVRVNQWANAYVANEGIVEGAASQAMRYRRALDGEDIVVLADVHVKHGSHAIVGDRDIEDQARDVEFFGAEVLIATGTRTGHATAPSEVKQIRAGSVGPILVGSGFS